MDVVSFCPFAAAVAISIVNVTEVEDCNTLTVLPEPESSSEIPVATVPPTVEFVPGNVKLISYVYGATVPTNSQ